MRTIWAIILTLLCFSAKSQFKISGLVMDKVSKKPLDGATVYISHLKKGTITDLEGYYEK